MIDIIRFLVVSLLVNGCSSESAIPIAVIHVGPHKTGSSWFQKLIFHTFLNDLEKENYYHIFKTEVEIKGTQNRDLAMCLSGRVIKNCTNVPSLYRDDIKNHYSLNHNIILSSEEFSADTLNFPEFFSLIEGFDVYVLTVYRDYASSFPSFHNTIYRLSQVRESFPAFFRACLNNQHCMHIATVEETVKRFSKYTSLDKIKIFDYNGIIAENEDVAFALLRFESLSKSLHGLPLDCLKDDEYQLLIELALSEDNKLRKNYEKIILYGNKTANIKRINEQVSSDVLCALDKKELAANPTVVNKIRETYNRCNFI